MPKVLMCDLPGIFGKSIWQLRNEWLWDKTFLEKIVEFLIFVLVAITHVHDLIGLKVPRDPPFRTSKIWRWEGSHFIELYKQRVVFNCNKVEWGKKSRKI